MVERKNGTRAHESLLRVEDLSILTAVEQLANGSAPPHLEMRNSTQTPLGVIDGTQSLKKIIELRNRLHIIPAQDASVELLGSERACTRTIMLRLPDIDPVTQEAEDLPSLFGVFVLGSVEDKFGRLITDLKKLANMDLYPEDVRGYLAKKLTTWRNGTGESQD